MKFPDCDNIKRIKSFYDAVARGDRTTARHVLDVNIDWIEPQAPGIWFSGPHRGADAVFDEVIEPAYEKIDKFHLKMKRFFPVGQKVIAIGSFRGRGKSTHLALNAPTAHVWTLRDGKAVRYEAFHDIMEWQVTLGLASIQEKESSMAA